jgi:hypothetical protein
MIKGPPRFDMFWGISPVREGDTVRRVTALTTAIALTGALGLAASTATAGVVSPATAKPAAIAKVGLPDTGGAPADAHALRKVVNRRAAVALGPRGELRGIALNDIGTTNSHVESTIADFPRMAAEGVTSVSVYVYLYVDSPTSTVVSAGAFTPSDDIINLVSAAASANGLQVQLQPVLLDRATSTWRGRYRPSNVPAFFASYTEQLVHYADLAQTLGVSLFYVGSENVQLEGRSADWTTLIGTVRKHYSGALSYLAILGSARAITWWNALDLAAVSPYFSLGPDALPTYDRMGIAWRTSIVPAVQTVVKGIRVPLIYGEIGYGSAVGAFTHPEVSPSKAATPAPAAQADAYRVLLDVLAGTSGVYGVTWWRWQAGTSVADSGYSPAGKPAECALASHWSENDVVRMLASLPVCDLHAIDTLLAAAKKSSPAHS